MSDIETTIQSITLPVALPEGAFVLFGKERRVPDFDLIIGQLPAVMRSYLDPNGTVSSSGPGTYLLPLVDGRYLKLKVQQHAITELFVISQ